MMVHIPFESILFISYDIFHDFSRGFYLILNTFPPLFFSLSLSLPLYLLISFSPSCSLSVYLFCLFHCLSLNPPYSLFLYLSFFLSYSLFLSLLLSLSLSLTLSLSLSLPLPLSPSIIIPLPFDSQGIWLQRKWNISLKVNSPQTPATWARFLNGSHGRSGPALRPSRD